jgi:acyl carrier protein
MYERLNSIFRDVFDDPVLEINDNLSRSNFGKWDSLEQVKLVIAIEEEFGVKFTTDEVSSIRSVAEFKRALADRKVVQ